jgi:hypothetical protein
MFYIGDRNMDYQEGLKLEGFRLVRYTVEESEWIKGNFWFATYARAGSRKPRRLYRQKFLEHQGEFIPLWLNMRVIDDPEMVDRQLQAAKTGPNVVFARDINGLAAEIRKISPKVNSPV